MIGLKVDALVCDCEHAIDLHQRQDSLDLEFTLEAELLRKALDARFVKPDFRVSTSSLVVETLDENADHLLDFTGDLVVERVARFALAVQAEQSLVKLVKLPVLQVEFKTILLLFVFLAELIHLVGLGRTLARYLNQLGHA